MNLPKCPWTLPQIPAQQTEEHTHHHIQLGHALTPSVQAQTRGDSGEQEPLLL